MKKLTILLGISIFAFACGGSSDKKAEETKSTTEQPAAAAPEAGGDEKGIELIAANDCLTCHKVSEKSVGPAYNLVAAKYTADEATITHLAGKVIKGGSGVWGEVPMTPHAALSEEDAKTMVKYILSLKK